MTQIKPNEDVSHIAASPVSPPDAPPPDLAPPTRHGSVRRLGDRVFSGGATTAPSTSAALSGRPGTSHHARVPATAVVNRTRPNASSPIGRRLALMPVVELFSAAEYSSGGRMSSSTTCGSIV